ncbi:MAG TPA: glycosyltransferase family 4 protein [Chitinophagaceae bacterium]|mgnify:CR=1 FL=1|nr:glycosyltransferase family 4 protein [Chitinophagaceae bacterium]
MKKVLAIAPYAYLPYYSGGQKYIAQFLDHLGKEIELSVISVQENDSSLAKTYKIIPLLKKGFRRYYDFSLVRKISEEIEKGGYDSIIWEHPYFAWLAFKIRKKTGIRTIIQTHNIEYQRFRSVGKWWWRILRWYEKRCLKKADTVFFITSSDKNFAITNWGLKPENCIDVPFGVEISKNPADKVEAQRTVKQKHNIPDTDKIILFNGLLRYKPNLDALIMILNKINPLLLQKETLKYKIIVCGKDLPAQLNELKEYQSKNIIYAGFVDDIEAYFKSADLFLNPVMSGGGIKTKMVEAIAFGSTVISTETGAEGIEKSVCGNKLTIVPDNDWEKFAEIGIDALKSSDPTPSQFYEYYSWENILRRTL